MYYFTMLSSFLDPKDAPGFTVSQKGRTFFYVRISEIANTSWNGVPAGYRVYYQSVLKLTSPVNLNDIKQIEQTHYHKNFTDFQMIKNQELAIEGLEDFTNYSLIVCAYNAHGQSPVTQVFNRTMQGGKSLSILENHSI